MLTASAFGVVLPAGSTPLITLCELYYRWVFNGLYPVLTCRSAPAQPKGCPLSTIVAGDVLRDSITDAGGAPLFDQSHDVTGAPAHECGVTCEELDLTFTSASSDLTVVLFNGERDAHRQDQRWHLHGHHVDAFRLGCMAEFDCVEPGSYRVRVRAV